MEICEISRWIIRRQINSFLRGSFKTLRVCIFITLILLRCLNKITSYTLDLHCVKKMILKTPNTNKQFFSKLHLLPLPFFAFCFTVNKTSFEDCDNSFLKSDWIHLLKTASSKGTTDESAFDVIYRLQIHLDGKILSNSSYQSAYLSRVEIQ